jgi:hypothetical protein
LPAQAVGSKTKLTLYNKSSLKPFFSQPVQELVTQAPLEKRGLRHWGVSRAIEMARASARLKLGGGAGAGVRSVSLLLMRLAEYGSVLWLTVVCFS